MQPASATPYCGEAPSPAELLSRWNFDPFLLSALAAATLAYVVYRRCGGVASDRLAGVGLLALAAAFVSPLCALSSGLFAARVAHHAALVALAAPCLAFALPRRRRTAPLAAATFVQAAVLWLWHAPRAYDWALSNVAAYWLMQLTLLGSAFLFWRATRAAPALAAAGALLATMMQMGLLGALITFAPRALYAPNLASTWAWGLSPLADQQLAGLIMWAPMSAAYLIAALALVARALGRELRAMPA